MGYGKAVTNSIVRAHEGFFALAAKPSTWPRFGQERPYRLSRLTVPLSNDVTLEVGQSCPRFEQPGNRPRDFLDGGGTSIIAISGERRDPFTLTAEGRRAKISSLGEVAAKRLLRVTDTSDPNELLELLSDHAANPRPLTRGSFKRGLQYDFDGTRITASETRTLTDQVWEATRHLSVKVNDPKLSPPFLLEAAIDYGDSDPAVTVHSYTYNPGATRTPQHPNRINDDRLAKMNEFFTLAFANLDIHR